MGWIKLDRKLLEHSLWNEKPFSKGQAWVDLLLLANHDTTKEFYKGEFKTFKRGCVHRSITWLADRWGWSRDKTRRHLIALQADSMLRIESSTHDTTITIENYDVYQGRRTTNDTTDDTTDKATDDTTDDTHTRRNKKDKEYKNIYIGKFDNKKYGEYENVLLSDDELEKLKNEYPDYNDRIESLSSYIASTGKKYKSHYATIKNWARKDKTKATKGKVTKANNFKGREYTIEQMNELEKMLIN